MVIRGGSAPLDVSVQVANTPEDVFRSPSEFYYRACQGVPRDQARRRHTLERLRARSRPLPDEPHSDSDLPAEIALVREVLDSLP